MSASASGSQPRWLWLSHVLAPDTPAYGGGKGLGVAHEKSLCAGDSCNAVRLDLHNHLGSHVDAPLHFIPDGTSVDSFLPEDWMFDQPLLVDLPLEEAVLITPEMIAPLLPATGGLPHDLLLIRTGFEKYRGEERFWKNGPGLSAALAPWIRANFKNLAAIGVDCISISSMQHREEGRSAHRALLGMGLRLFEDLALAALPQNRIKAVIALPLRFCGADGSPCTIVAEIV